MHIYTQKIKESESNKVISIIIPTPDINADIYKRSVRSVYDAVRDLSDYEVHLVSVEDSGENFRFSKSVNRGIDEMDANFYLNMNDDVILDSDAISHSIETLELDKNIGLLGAILYYPNKKIQHAGIGVAKPLSYEYFKVMFIKYHAPFYSLRKIIAHRRGSINDFVLLYHSEKIHELKYGLVTGAYHFFTKSAVKTTGGYDENYKMGMEDVDYCLSIIKHGFKVRLNPEVEGIHYETYHGINYSLKYGDYTEKYFYSKWDVDSIFRLLKTNDMLYTDA